MLLLASIGAGVPRAAWAGEASPAQAGGVQVNPVRVTLSSQAPTSTITLRNSETESMRFQVTAFTWTQGPHGEVELSPTKDVSFFPSLFTLSSGESKQLRVGVSAPAGAKERSYRLIVEQLPPLTTPETARHGIRVLTRLSIPVFLQPGQVTMQGRIEDIGIDHGKLSYALKNTGSVHFMVPEVNVTGRDASGAVLFERKQAGWYLLPGGSRLFDLEVPAASCPKLSSLAIDAKTDGSNIRQITPVTGARCGG